MNVLMTADTVGGVFTYALELAAALAPHGVEVALATKGRVLSAEQWTAVRRVPRLEVFESADRLEWMEDPWEDVARSSAWLVALAEELRPDVIHLNDYAHGALPFPAPRLVVAHSCVCSWFEAVRREPPPPTFDRYREEVRRGLAGADLVVAPSRFMLDALTRHYGPLPRARVIPNGRSSRGLAPAEKEELVLSAGRLWDDAKNVRLLDRAAAGLPWPVLVAGAEAHPDPAHAGRSSVRHARALGHLTAEALASFYRRAAIYTLPARYEPFGLSVVEAALAGCALVLGDVPSLREVWGEAAVFVDPESAEGLHRTLRGLIDREALRRDLGERARERALALSPERMAAAYLDAYRELVAGGAGAARREPAPCAS